jgi:hypothetical protein
VPDGEGAADAVVQRLLPGLERRPTRRGNVLLASRGGHEVHGTPLPRLGDPPDAAEPLFVGRSFGWERPEPVPAPRAGGWKECFVRYRFRGVLDLFYREVFDEPDVPARDLRVRGFVQRMLDGTEALPVHAP